MQLLRFAVTTAVAGAGRLLRIAGATIENMARGMQSRDVAATPMSQASRLPTQVSDGAAVAPTAAARQDVEDRVGRVIQLPDTPLLDAEPHQRRPETHIEELASQPAASVIGEIDRLSTDELRLLIEHETAHRNRKTVLRAIENALAPAGAGH